MARESLVVVRTSEDVSRLAERYASGSRRRTVLLQLPSLGPMDAATWERRINRDANSCGCNAGAFGLFVGVLALAGYFFTHQDTFIVARVRWAMIAPLFIVACALVGKSLGVLAARNRLVRSLLELKRQVDRNPAR